MNRQSHASSLFLLELILAILFFSIASAVCVQLFVKAHLLSTDSRALNAAVNECASAAEILNASGSMEEAVSLLQSAWPDAEAQRNGDNPLSAEVTQPLDAAFLPVSSEEAPYCLRISLTEEAGALNGDIVFDRLSGNSGEEAVYTLHVRHHLQRRTGDE